MCFVSALWEGTKTELTFAQLANVQTVGIGLYLALAVVQAISTTGVAGLSRRVTTLRTAVTNGKLGTVEVSNVRRLAGDVSGLEIGFHALNRQLLTTALLLFIISIAYFAYCTVWQTLNAGAGGTWFIFLFYLALPILIFLASMMMIKARCSAVAKRIVEAEQRIRASLLKI